MEHEAIADVTGCQGGWRDSVAPKPTLSPPLSLSLCCHSGHCRVGEGERRGEESTKGEEGGQGGITLVDEGEEIYLKKRRGKDFVGVSVIRRTGPSADPF